MKNYKIETNVVSPKRPKPDLTKLVFIYVFYFNIHGKLSAIKCYT